MDFALPDVYYDIGYSLYTQELADKKTHKLYLDGTGTHDLLSSADITTTQPLNLLGRLSAAWNESGVFNVDYCLVVRLYILHTSQNQFYIIWASCALNILKLCHRLLPNLDIFLTMHLGMYALSQLIMLIS